MFGLDDLVDGATGLYDSAASGVGAAWDGANRFSDAASHAIHGAEHAVTEGWHIIEDEVDAGTHSLARQVADVPILGSVAEGAADVATFGTQVVGGITGGATTLVGGLANAVVNPIDTAVGLGTMASHMPGPLGTTMRMAQGAYGLATGERSVGGALDHAFNPLTATREDGAYWSNVGSALARPYRESWNEGRYGEVVGRGAFDIALLLSGVGEAEAAGSAGRVAEVADVARVAETADVARIAETADVARAAEVADGARAAEVADGARAAEAADGARAAEAADGARAAEATDGARAAEAGEAGEGARLEARTRREPSPDSIYELDEISMEVEQITNPELTPQMAEEWNTAAGRMAQTEAGNQALAQLNGRPRLVDYNNPELVARNAGAYSDGTNVTIGMNGPNGAGMAERLEMTAVHEGRHLATQGTEVESIARSVSEEAFIEEYLVHEGRSYGSEIRYADEAIAAAERAGDVDRVARLTEARGNTLGYDAYRAGSTAAYDEAIAAGRTPAEATAAANEAGARAVGSHIGESERAAATAGESSTGYIDTARDYWRTRNP